MSPQDMPIASWAPGDVEAVTFAIYPDAWRLLGGSAQFDDIPESIAVAVDAFAKAPDPDAGWAAFCGDLSVSWATARPSTARQIDGISDWVRTLVTQAVVSGRGQSLRAVERRLKRLSGLTRRKLAFYAAFDTLFRISRENADRPLVEIALNAGYSDQSHMGRAIRRATGFTPKQLNRAIESDEAFWCYRLLGERF